MASSSYQVIGTSQLKKRIEDLNDLLVKKVMASAVRDAAKIVVRAARVNVPKKTGKLRRSIGVRTLPRRGMLALKPGVDVGPRMKKGSPLQQGWAGAMVESGTTVRQTKKGANRGSMQGVKYMYRAGLTSKKAVQNVMESALTKAINKFGK